MLKQKDLLAITKSQKEKIDEFRHMPKQGIKVKYLGKIFIVKPNVFIPYADSQALVKKWKINKNDTVLDIGTGCGVLAIFAAYSGVKQVIATDINQSAIKNAKINVKLHKFTKKVKVQYSDIFSNIDKNKKFDVIIANLPFRDKKAKDNIEASFWDTDFKAHKKLFKQIKKHLNENGRLYTTQSNYGALSETKKLAREAGFKVKLIGKMVGSKKPLKIFYAYELTKK